MSMMLAVLLAVLPAPPQHADFDHYTFALTWQPGICETGEGHCVADQPKTPLIGLHGLWASLPRDLASQGVVDKEWWAKGCDFYHPSSGPPPLDPPLRAQLEGVMPHFEHSLLVHEYDKHVQCFGFDPAQFFTTELAMRDAVASSAFGRYLVAHAGADVTHTEVVAQFAASFATDRPTALQLQCGKSDAGAIVLTQFWITIHTDQIDAFPKPASLMATPTNQDTCPATFHIPTW
ncbi:MAG TPA: ribonuclease I [Verrucomicrobiae bacterium]|nr:ribonuclease I [Verrucomicrobiae bacterium]